MFDAKLAHELDCGCILSIEANTRRQAVTSRLAPETIAVRDFSQSLARGLAILELFRDDVTYLTPSAVATEVSVSRASARRLLLTLQDLGYLQGDGRRFWLTPRILRLGQNLFAVNGLWQLVNHRVVELANFFNEPCAAAVLDGVEITYVARDSARHIFTSRLAIGDRMPAHCSSLGKILLAALPPIEIDALLSANPLAKRTEKTITNPLLLKAELDQVRHNHWAKVDGEMDDGTISIAVPLRGTNGGLVAALNVASHQSRCDVATMIKTMLPNLQVAAQEIEVIIRSYELRGPR